MAAEAASMAQRDTRPDPDMPAEAETRAYVVSPDPDVGAEPEAGARCASPCRHPRTTAASAATSASAAPGDRARHHASTAATGVARMRAVDPANSGVR